MTLTYQQHFDQRGSAYDIAMQRFPSARQEEFLQAIEAAQIKPGMTIADVPAGGGYLKRYLTENCTWLGHEPCASFTNHGKYQPVAVPLLPLPWTDECIDRAISLAGVHHIENKTPFFKDLKRVVKPGGRLVVSDVAGGSAVSCFLDGYVGKHNSTGHKGFFLGEATLDELDQSGWNLVTVNTNAFHWNFSNRYDMARFCHTLFDLRTSTERDTQQAIEAMLGVDDLPGGGVGMRWELVTITAIRD